MQYVVLLPTLLTLIYLGTHAALWYLSRHAALASAQEGVRAARAYNAPAGAGEQAARRYAASFSSGLLTDVTVSVTRTSAGQAEGGGTVEVQVSGRGLSLVPGLDTTVRQTARGPMEYPSAPDIRSGTGAAAQAGSPATSSTSPPMVDAGLHARAGAP
ncbi:pilus assembly protein [Spongiactinospora rosea]|uniref:pilus assembly protein n=1 Tax=Spongiactinospora rosea TaxID=2248750 RepID=UPI0011C02A17|nr:pilus assembly protein [Spongiactinospora rosea]